MLFHFTTTTKIIGIIKNNFADEIMLNPKEIARQYLKTWFLLDLLSSLPLDYIYLILHDNENFTQFVHAGKFPRVLFLYDIVVVVVVVICQFSNSCYR